MRCEHQVVSGLISGDDICKLREAVCIQVEKVYDHCKEKDCVEDAVIQFDNENQARRLIRTATKVRTKAAEVEQVSVDLEEVPFKKGFYTAEIRYKIRVWVEFNSPRCPGVSNTCVEPGYVFFNKTVILFGSEGKVKIFESKKDDCVDGNASDLYCKQDNLPITKVEVAQPIVLNTRIMKICPMPKHHENKDCDWDCDWDDDDDDNNRKSPDDNCDNVAGERFRPILPQREVVVTLGLFSIIKLVRYVQLLIPAFSFCFPNKECIASTDEDPCELFDTIDFPMDEFFPPQKFDFPGAVEAEEDFRGDDNRPILPDRKGKK